MFSLAYVLLPFGDLSPADAITASLARFQRGGSGDVPEEWLRFHDETAHVNEVLDAQITFTREQGLRTEGADSFYLDTHPILEDMEERGTKHWKVRFADEMAAADFVARYMPRLVRHPATGGFGQWLNGLGRWDWWDLGGRYDGVITGESADRARPRSDINSGPSAGRDMVANIEAALSEALDQTLPPEIDVATDRNVELVSRLLDDQLEGPSARRPGVVLLPPGAVPDEERWLRNWPEIGPTAALDWLGVRPDAAWPEIVRAAYVRFHDHWAAGVAFHH